MSEIQAVLMRHKNLMLREKKGFRETPNHNIGGDCLLIIGKFIENQNIKPRLNLERL